ncbi:MAG: hypothetical protein JW902_13705 [Syntrophaceae bacterium]|nr:hypothetical protein [Syntrophaceae bacterium]
MIGSKNACRPSGKGHGKDTRPAWMLLTLPVMLTLILVACNEGTKTVPVNNASEAVTPITEPATNGSELLNERCSTCHGLSKIKQARKAPSQWDQTVNRMIAKGARLTEAEKILLLDYLNMNFAP